MSTDTENLPIYLLGKTPLSLYLADKFSAIGEKAIIVSPPNDISSQEVVIKEEYNLQKHKFLCQTSSYTFSKAKLLVITSNIQKLKSELLLISQKNMANTPCVIFSDKQDISIAETLVGKPLIRAWFNGWLMQEDKQISLYGNEPEIVLSKDYNNIENCLSALALINRCGIKTFSTEEQNNLYWENFAIKIIASMLSAKEQQNIAQICKNKEKREIINSLSEEMASLAACNGAHIIVEDICKKIYAIPSHYKFTAQELDTSAVRELKHYYHNLINRIAGEKLRLPTLNGLMKEIYLRINPF